MSVHSPVDRTATIHQLSPAILTAFRWSTVVGQEEKVVDRQILVQMVVEVLVHSPFDRTATIHPFFSGDFDCFPVVNGRWPRRESCRSANSGSYGGGGVPPVRS